MGSTILPRPKKKKKKKEKEKKKWLAQPDRIYT